MRSVQFHPLQDTHYVASAPQERGANGDPSSEEAEPVAEADALGRKGYSVVSRGPQSIREMNGPNNSIEPTEASRLGQPQFVAQWRLASAAHAERSA
jgi:hypothetical protein